MRYKEYEITHFRPDLLGGVVEVLRDLWGDDHENNLSYFKWKYIQNPYTENPLGIVALYKKKVVGFRGYFATRWQVTGSLRSIIILSSGDVCVHPDHRYKGLFVASGKFAMGEYASMYPMFLTLSVSKNSMPGALKAGYMPLIDKVCLNRTGLLGLLKFMLSAGPQKKLDEVRIPFGKFGAIEVSGNPKPKQMADVFFSQSVFEKKIQLLQDEQFFRWRFNNKRIKYVFVYYKPNKKITGYLVFRVSANNRRGYIVDFAFEKSSALEEILAFCIKNKFFNIMSVYSYSLTDRVSGILKKFHFKTDGITGFIEKKINGEWPVLVRPVKRNYTENDVFIEDIDIRKVQNWWFKEICSDGS